MRYLAIDYGERRIGLAVSDDAGDFSWPHGTHERVGTRRDVEYLVQVVRGLGIEGIVFGLPRATTGGEGKSEDSVRAFARALQEALDAANIAITAEWWDERYSTQEALGQMRRLGISQRQGRESSGSNAVDARAAAVILQGFLDRKKDPQQVLNNSEPDEAVHDVAQKEDLF